MQRLILENVGLTGIKNWLTEKHKTKKSGEEFTLTDIQGYVRRNKLPSYLGGYEIKEIRQKFEERRRYNIIEN